MLERPSSASDNQKRSFLQIELKKHQQADTNKKETKSQQEVCGVHTGSKIKIKMKKKK